MHKLKGSGVVADGHELCTAGIAALFTKELGLVAKSVHNLEQAITSLTLVTDTLVLAIDLNLPGMRGPESIRMLRYRFPGLKILVLSDFGRSEAVFQSLSAGAHGFVLRSAPLREIAAAVRTILSGNIFVPAWIAERQEAANDTLSAGSLTRRQSEIVGLMSQGNSNKAIARALGISPSTVKVHLHAAFRTLGVHSRVCAASASVANHHAGTLV